MGASVWLVLPLHHKQHSSIDVKSTNRCAG